jgi:hypothetical protein
MQQVQLCLLLVILLKLLLDPENEGDVFPEKLVDFHWTTQIYIPEEGALVSIWCNSVLQIRI